MPEYFFYQESTEDSDTGPYQVEYGETPVTITGLTGGTEYRIVDPNNEVHLVTPLSG